jgi:hypothetical protein
MITLGGGATKIHLATEPIDLRRGYSGLYTLFEQQFSDEPQSGNFWVFANQRRNLLKIFWWDDYVTRVIMGHCAVVDFRGRAELASGRIVAGHIIRRKAWKHAWRKRILRYIYRLSIWKCGEVFSGGVAVGRLCKISHRPSQYAPFPCGHRPAVCPTNKLSFPALSPTTSVIAASPSSRSNSIKTISNA